MQTGSRLRRACPKKCLNRHNEVEIPKHEKRIPLFDDQIISMYDRRMTDCEIRGHLEHQVPRLERNLVAFPEQAVQRRPALFHGRPLVDRDLAVQPMIAIVCFPRSIPTDLRFSSAIFPLPSIKSCGRSGFSSAFFPNFCPMLNLLWHRTRISLHFCASRTYNIAEKPDGNTAHSQFLLLHMYHFTTKRKRVRLEQPLPTNLLLLNPNQLPR